MPTKSRCLQDSDKSQDSRGKELQNDLPGQKVGSRDPKKESRVDTFNTHTHQGRSRKQVHEGREGRIRTTPFRKLKTTKQTCNAH